MKFNFVGRNDFIKKNRNETQYIKVPRRPSEHFDATPSGPSYYSSRDAVVNRINIKAFDCTTSETNVVWTLKWYDDKTVLKRAVFVEVIWWILLQFLKMFSIIFRYLTCWLYRFFQFFTNLQCMSKQWVDRSKNIVVDV